MFRYLKQVTINKIQLIQGLQSPVNSRMYTDKARAVTNEVNCRRVHPKSHNKGSLDGLIGSNRSFSICHPTMGCLIGFNYCLETSVQTDMRFTDCMFGHHKGDQLAWWARDKVLKRASQRERPVTIGQRTI